MNRIILAYAPENAAFAASIDHQLSRIGIPFEHAKGSLAAAISSAPGEPVLLLVTDNLLKNRDCLEGLLPVVQQLAVTRQLVVVIADGIDENGRSVETHIDRMANALHYMNHWQNVWLALSDRHQHASGEAKAALVEELDRTRMVANEMGDFISTLREAGYLSQTQFEANDFEAFFKKFGLEDWHGQYKRLVAQLTENQNVVESPHLPEMPVNGGVLAPEPIEEVTIPTQKEEPLIEQPEEPEHIVPLPEPAVEAAPEPVDTGVANAFVREAARDAWFWIEKGHPERGMELFKMALEQYPDNEWLQTEFQKASAQMPSAPADEVAAQEIQHVDTSEAEPVKKVSEEAKSYDLMGDMAAERGDYLFAKYCWDRVVEIDPHFENIYRKLGLMTAEHLLDYRDTALSYLRKALEINPNDSEVKQAIAGDSAPTPTDQQTPVSEPPAAPEPPETPPVPAPEPLVPKTPEPAPIADLVLITGATSGIGRATAEIFARKGYRLILTGRRVDRLVELKNRFESEYDSDVLLLPFDVRDAGAVEAALGNLPESFQNVDILINNAGLAKGLAPIHEGKLEHWETMIDTNVKGLLYVTRMISQGMVKRRQGHIINVCSSAGREAYPNGNVYCATKFAVDALTKSIRFDLHAYNIRVSQVSPGHVEETEFALNRFDGDAERARIYNDFQPLKSSDVAEAIYFMATRPPHVNIQDIQMFATQQASSMVINRSGREL